MILVLRRRTRRLIGGVLALSGTLLITAALASAGVARLTMARLEPLRQVQTPTNDIALTFDISWGTEMPAKIADILETTGVQATVFVSGPWASRNTELLQRFAAQGHELASHGYKHSNMSAWNESQIEEAITLTHRIIKDATGQESCFIRPPNGDYDDLVITVAAKTGYTVVIWSLDSLDWLNPGVGKIVDRVVSRAKPGDIILMHASDTCKQTDQALPAVIEGLRGKGLEMVTLRDLLFRAQLLR